MRVMILAAGRGKRLQPLTHHVPKPMIEVAGKPLIVHTLEALKQAGLTEIVINVAHLKDKIVSALGNGQQFGLHIEFSQEEEPLETGGGIYQALPLLGDAPFIVVSADIWSDYPFHLLKKHELQGLAHLVLVDNPPFHPKGDYGLEEGRLTTNSSNLLNYAGMCLLSPALFANCRAGIFPVAPLFEQAIRDQQATGEHFKGAWHNIGTLKELHSLEAYLSSAVA